MSYLSPLNRQRILAQIATKETQLELANTAYSAALASGDTESYLFDSKEGKQSTTLRSPSVLFSQIQRLEADLDRLYRRLSGTGVITMNLRRR